MIKNRDERLGDLLSRIESGEVDDDVLVVLERLNSNACYMTTSSCSGRIQLIELPSIGNKKESVVLAKWHRAPSLEVFFGVIDGWSSMRRENDGTDDTCNTCNVLYLMAQSPIFHVEADTLRSAVRLRNMAQECGFKYSTLRSVKLDRGTGEPIKITVELLSGEAMHVPLGENGEIICGRDYLKFVFERAVMHLERANKKLGELEDGLSGSDP